MEKNIELKSMDNFEKRCRMTMEDFKQGAEYYCYTDDDGFGFYATQNGISNIYVDFAEILNGDYPSWATHVCWFNK